MLGEEAQVGFGDIADCLILFKIVKVYAFNMCLSDSKLDYYEIVFDQKVETLIRCHVNAFKYFKVFQKHQIDNLKPAIIEDSFYELIY